MVEMRDFSLQWLNVVGESRCLNSDGDKCLSVWPQPFSRMDVMVDLRLNWSSADWINNAASGLWMWGAPVLTVLRRFMDYIVGASGREQKESLPVQKASTASFAPSPHSLREVQWACGQTSSLHMLPVWQFFSCTNTLYCSQNTSQSPWKYTVTQLLSQPLSVPLSACGLMRFNDQALLPSSVGLVRSALAGQSSALSLSWHLLEQWDQGRQPMGRRSIPGPVPVCTQLGLGTVELLNWRKIALYLGFSARAHPCPPVLHAWSHLTQNWMEKMTQWQAYKKT